MKFNLNTYHWNYLVSFERAAWEQARDLYHSLPEPNDEEVKKLVKSDKEVQEFIKRYLDVPWMDMDADKPDECELIVEFVGEEFMLATRQPQHLLLPQGEVIMERLVWYYRDLAVALFDYYYHSGWGSGLFSTISNRRILSSTQRRRDYLLSHPRDDIQLKQRLLLEHMSMNDYWAEYNYEHALSEFIDKNRFIHTTRDFPTDRDMHWSPSVDGWTGIYAWMWYKAIVDAYVRELDMYIDADQYNYEDESPELVYSFMDNLDI